MKPPSSIDLEVSRAFERADQGLHQELLPHLGAHLSRTTVKRWLVAGAAVSRGRALKPTDRLELGQPVTVTPLPEPGASLTPDASVEFRVIFEDRGLIVIDKPPHLVVHPAKGHWEGTLVHGLLARGSFRREAFADCSRPGIVHRIDKGTSGVMVVAKTEAVREALKLLFQTHDIEREYDAIVIGSPREGTFDTPHGRHPTDRLRFTSWSGPKRAITHVTPLEALEHGHSLIRCTLETGRTHQIRVHLAERGKTPILGDAVYGTRSPLIDRPALHARKLGFVHPLSGEHLSFEAPPPADWQRAYEALKIGAAPAGSRDRKRRSSR